MNYEFITIIVGFLGLLLMIWQLNYQMCQRFDSLKSDMDSRFDNLKSDMDSRFDNIKSDMDSRFDSLNNRIDKIYDIVIDLYRTLFKKDAA